MSTPTSECNSAGRVSRCQRDCRRFESGHSLHFFCLFSVKQLLLLLEYHTFHSYILSNSKYGDLMIMKKLFLGLVGAMLFGTVFAGDVWIECSEKNFKGHLQGIAADESGIYWSFYDTLLKTDYYGKKLALFPRISHMGDLCVVNGKVYVALTIYGPSHIVKHDNWQGWVLVFDAGTLKYLGRHKMAVPAVDGIAFLDGKFYVGVAAERELHPLNKVLVYDKEFKFLKELTLDIGQKTFYGAQTINPFGSRLLFSFYGEKKKKSYIFEPDDLTKIVDTFPVRTSYGMAAVPKSIAGAENVFLIAHNTGKARSWSARLKVVQLIDGKLQPFKLPLK